MASLLWTIAAVNGAILLAEFIIWIVFQRKAEPLSFPHELDTSYFRFFELSRMRLIAVGHALLLVVAASACLFLLW
jgi:hypothetical protein